ncbi:MAG TPA: hypothetical protein VLG25_00230 [Patescibacteria group bacterium]|nr:hypothetical protein [Patescibacteria group bacterium]
MERDVFVEVFETASLSKRLDKILGRAVSAETIDNYASTALSDIVDVVSDATTAYLEVADEADINSLASNAEIEDAAQKHFGLVSISEILDHISAKDDELKRIDQIIGTMPITNTVIVPTDEGVNPIVGSGNGLKEPEYLPKTKLILFVLANEFDIDLNDKEQFDIHEGTLPDNSMRTQSYRLIEANKIKRAILVCDEKGNTTYILNSEKLDNAGISSETLGHLGKDEIKTLLEGDPELGRKLKYSNNFTRNLVEYLGSDEKNVGIYRKARNPENIGRYLMPEAPEGILSINGISKALGISQDAVESAIKDLGLDHDGEFRFRNATTGGYGFSKQDQIKLKLEDTGRLAPVADEDELSFAGFATTIGSTAQTVSQVVKRHGQTIGATPEKKFSGVTTRSLSPRQQEDLRKIMEAEGFRPAPENHHNVIGIAKATGHSRVDVRRALRHLSDVPEFGETVRGIVAGRLSPDQLYSPEQISQIHEWIIKNPPRVRQ